MKIWGDNPKIYGVYNKPGPTGKFTQKDVVASKKDEFSISGLAKEYQVAMRALRNIPDIREDKVKEISRKIERGEYYVSAEDIAEKLIQLC
ncbi:flagellar biosynthesis anti-sigma factor FlgM [Thermoclostridium stercorarium]|uniref:flagellar biosynthesis anti-sigma factor FlgM n=1 Tax=Thermoclostridium stercorarium TaxID=1510 RepID=UPI0006CF39BE|nr:flagellar biosynthesis anti-sigma factor FlgM [Thermoclostridium stercorarium]